MTVAGRLLALMLDDQRYGLDLVAVEEVVRVVAVTPLPDAPEIVTGIVNVRGRVVPVVDIRQRFGLPVRAPTLTDQLIVATTARRSVAFVVDAVMDVLEWTERDIVEADAIAPGLGYLQGVATLADGMVLIHDLD
ncbi:MAG: purine-binding chemotaxis protein CheW, partial [Burkholderiales bacterium]|nr:purine-binding chemotaxis protein CheW [Burkholderiales bacterium]